MNITGHLREAIQVAVLQSLQAVHPMRMTAEQLLTPVKLATQQTQITKQDLASLLADMKEGGLVTDTASPLNLALITWQRTDKARAFLESSGLL